MPREFIPIYHPAFHHKTNAPEHGNVLQRIAGHCDEIGEFSRFDAADAILPVDDLAHSNWLRTQSRRRLVRRACCAPRTLSSFHHARSRQRLFRTRPEVSRRARA